MQNYEGFKKAGNFMLSDGTEVQGELCLNGAATTLDLYSDSFVETHAADISGILYDRSKVSLINCITMSRELSYNIDGATDGATHHSSRFFPHFVIFGEQHITSSCRIIREMTFTVDDAATLFYDRDAFGSVIDAKSHMERIIKEDKMGREIEIGENPLLFYFTGKSKIFSVDTLLGEIFAWHSLSYSFPGSEGIHVDNTIKLNITFSSEKTVEEAIESLIDIKMFLEIIAGRPQNISELELLPVNAENHPKFLSIYWCMPPCRNGKNESSKPSIFDLPLKETINPDEFNSVFTHWLQRHDEWRNARLRFSKAFANQNYYDIDRIVGAANMFDILPSSAYPQTITHISPDLADARDNAQKAFKMLPVSPERDSILNALGRIGTATLKRKVRSRAKLITDKIKFPEFELVVDQAIDCRNYYVHGSDTKIDYSRNTDLVTFFTDTLEFIFAASDLVESGWDITAWANQGTTCSHPFGRYLIDYQGELCALKDLLSVNRNESKKG
jgi:ApeA N-terminal domain 1